MRKDNRQYNLFMILSVSAILMCLSQCARAYPTTIYSCKQKNNVTRYSANECLQGKKIDVDNLSNKTQTLDLGLRPYEKVLLERMHQIRAIKANNDKKIKLDMIFNLR